MVKRRMLVIAIIISIVMCISFFIRFPHGKSRINGKNVDIALQHSSFSRILENATPRKIDYAPEPLQYEKIFSDDHGWVATLAAKRIRSVVATGDIIPARSVNMSSVNRNDFTWAFRNIARLLNSADVTFINLETPLLSDCKPTTEGMVFCGSARHVEGLVYAGVDIVSVANNHAGNYGSDGVKATKELLEKNGIAATGNLGPIVKDIKGKRFAFLGYNDIGGKEEMISWADNDTIRREVGAAKKQADVVLVMYHWGIEYVRQPSTRQRELAHLAIDAGADLVLGNHPHWIQPLEIYRGKLIIYAHGNTIFDQMWSEDTKYGVIGKYVFYDATLVDVEYFPTYIKDFDGQPELLVGAAKNGVLSKMKEASVDLVGL